MRSRSGELEYGLQPMQVRAANIAVRGAKSGDDLDLRVSRLNAAFALEGPLGRRTLVIERAALAGVSVTCRGAGELGGRHPRHRAALGAEPAGQTRSRSPAFQRCAHRDGRAVRRRSGP
ncbi:MAG: hypothetical protein MZV70_60390 [Desulfobacterales bacterium]|nr:hypothetical protein [Desulfobacterales bacterium]